jgi:murein tripeptide amidase MpaA
MKGALATLAVTATFAAAALAAPFRRTERYYGEKVYQCTFNDEKSAAAMNDAVNNLGFDMWKAVANGNVHVYDIRVTRSQNRMYGYMFQNCAVIIPDVEKYMIEAEEAMTPKAPASYFESYHNYEDTRAFYLGLAEEFPNLASFLPNIGQTYENREIFGFRFTGTGGSNKPSIFFQCQIHAREWISSATCGYIINELLTNYANNGTETAVMDSVVFYVIPIINPDGYSYTWTNDRLWRKNRNPNDGAACSGVDINRNYNSHWGEGGSSGSACSDTYRGPAFNSELESLTTISFFKQAAPSLMAIDFHSYSQLILRPYGWTRTDAPDEALLKEIGDGMRDEIAAVFGTRYTSQKSIDLYVTTGTTSDWFYDEEATSYNAGFRAAGYTLELRDTGRYGFQLPPDQIIPSGQETLPAIIYAVQRIVRSPIRA